MKGKQFLFLILILLATVNVFAQESAGFRIINYNALHGFSGDSVLKAKFVQWVKTIDPDVVAFEEMNGFMQNDLGNLAESYGHPYAVIMNREFGVPVTHPIAITSKYPILNVRRVMDNMWHGYLYATIKGVNIFVTHLAPFTLKDRQKDIAKILAQAALIPSDEKIMLAGDFNSLSPKDSSHYGDDLLTSMKRIEGRLEPKSGTPIVRNRIIYRNNLNHGKIDFSVIQQIIDNGFSDSFYLSNKEFKNSIPTNGHAHSNSIPLRIDYVWLNKALAPYFIKSTIIQDEITDQLSDHYPVLVELNL